MKRRKGTKTKRPANTTALATASKSSVCAHPGIPSISVAGVSGGRTAAAAAISGNSARIGMTEMS